MDGKTGRSFFGRFSRLLSLQGRFAAFYRKSAVPYRKDTLLLLNQATESGMKGAVRMPKVIMTCGKICSGKSTYAGKLRKEGRAVVLSIDEIILALHGQDAGDKLDDDVKKTKAYLYQKSLEIIGSGIDVILDWGFWTKAERDYARSFYGSEGIANEIHYIDIDDDEWRRRIEKRNRDTANKRGDAYYIDEGLLAKFESKFEKPDPSEIDRWIRQPAQTDLTAGGEGNG